jgi:hypothetical protein
MHDSPSSCPIMVIACDWVVIMRRLILAVGFLIVVGFAGVCEELSICSFNIQFLGQFTNRDNVSLAAILSDYDIVVVQELVAPPFPLTFPDGTTARADDEARIFFQAMICRGFSYWLSEEDTGPGEENHLNNTQTEWWVVFYKPESVDPAPDLPWGFLDEDRTGNTHYERVPYAFPFRSSNGNADFVLVSVHLDPHSSQRRLEELETIQSWVTLKNQTEKDFIILGDMNIQSCTELKNTMPSGFVSLNAACQATNTARNRKPYDHVLLQPEFTTEASGDLVVVDLASVMRPYWTSDEPYPGDPYDHNAFRVVYSDHCPIVFKLSTDEPDDD